MLECVHAWKYFIGSSTWNDTLICYRIISWCFFPCNSFMITTVPCNPALTEMMYIFIPLYVICFFTKAFQLSSPTHTHHLVCVIVFLLPCWHLEFLFVFEASNGLECSKSSISMCLQLYRGFPASFQKGCSAFTEQRQWFAFLVLSLWTLIHGWLQS